MIVNKINMDWVKSESKRIETKKSSSRSGDLPEIKWYSLKEGETTIRLLPPWSSTGIPFFRQAKHWAMPPNRSIHTCLVDTFPNDTDTCYFCDILNKIRVKFPERKLWRHSSSSQYLVNAVIREDEENGTKVEEEGPQLVRLPEAAYNWLIQQLENPKIGPLVFDVEKGCDFKITITKTKAKGKKKESTKYAFTFMPGTSPLHEDEEIVEKWCAGIIDITKIIKYPSDEKLSEEHAAAQVSYSAFLKSFRDNMKESMDMNGLAVGSSEKSDKKALKERVASSTKADPKSRVVEDDDLDEDDDDDLDDSDDSDDEPFEKSAKSSQTKEPELRSKAPDVSTKELTSKAKSAMSSLQKESPSDELYPTCFAGNSNPEPHEDGSIGFSEVLEKCMICAHELKCVSIKIKQGK